MRGPVTALGEDGEEIEIAPDEDGQLVAYVFKTLADPYAGRLNLFRVFSGVIKGDSQVTNVTRRAKERIGQILIPGGKEHEQTDELGAGDIGAIAKLKETRAGDVLAEKDTKISFPPLDLPAPVMAFAFEPKTKGDEDKAASAIRRLEEEDPTLDVHRDQQTGEQIIAGLTQIHVEVIVDRMKDRFGAEIELHPPRVPYLEAIRKPAKAHGRYKKQTGGRGQFGDCHLEIAPGEAGSGYEFIDEIKGGAIPKGFIPAVEKGVAEAMQHGTLAGYPVKDLQVRLYDGQYHRVDSSENAFKIAGSMAFKDAMEQADPVLLEPIMLLTVSVPEDVVGDVVGDLNSRRGRPLGMEAKGSATEIKAEVPMAEVLDYAPRPAPDHRRPRRLHDGVHAPRGDPLAPGAEGDLRGPLRGGSPGLKLVVNVDGGSRGNPGPAAVAAVVTDPSGEELAERAETIGRGDQQRGRVPSAAARHRARQEARRRRGRAGRGLAARSSSRCGATGR